MQKIHQTIFINAPREKVWKTMLEDATYREWTRVFSPTPNSTSRYEGSWDKGSKILFIGTAEDGSEGGLVSRIAESRLHEFISIEHMGLYGNGVEDTTSEVAKEWAGMHENYTFNAKENGTELVIDLDITEKERVVMEAAWQKALIKLKELVESN